MEDVIRLWRAGSCRCSDIILIAREQVKQSESRPRLSKVMISRSLSELMYYRAVVSIYLN